MKTGTLLSALLTALTITAAQQAYASEAVNSTPLYQQRLTTTFKRGDIKFDWDCSGKVAQQPCANGTPHSIEVTAYATSGGSGDSQREAAFRIAELKAKAKLRHFLNEEVTSTRVVTTLSKNIEKADDRLQNGSKPTATQLSEEEADRSPSYVVRENTASVARTLSETVKSRSSGIMRGIYIQEAKVVDRQTVAVTIRWDKSSDGFSQKLRLHLEQ